MDMQEKDGMEICLRSLKLVIQGIILYLDYILLILTSRMLYEVAYF